MNNRFGRGWMSELLREFSIHQAFLGLLRCESSLLLLLQTFRLGQRLGLLLHFFLPTEIVGTQVIVVFREALLGRVQDRSKTERRVFQRVAGQAVLNKLNDQY